MSSALMPAARVARLVLAGLALAAVATPGRAPAADDTAALHERLAATARAHRYALEYDGNAFSGPAWTRLIDAGRGAQFFLLGEQHGIAENAHFAAALFSALSRHGYRHLAVETSPQMAQALDSALREGGLAALQRLYALPGGEPAFFGMAEEAGLLAAARAAIAGEADVLWGLDYEVASDRHLIRRLRERAMPEAARAALDALSAASQAAWARHAATQNPGEIFSFAGDPHLVRDLRLAWPDRDRDVEWTLDTLEETLEINALWRRGEGWRSNARRAALLRANFVRYWRDATAGDAAPRVFAKFGASHMMRGLSTNETFDLGALLPEIAAVGGASAFSLLVLAGEGAEVANFDPVAWTYRSGAQRDPYAKGLAPLFTSAWDDTFTLIDLRPLRRLLGASQRAAAGDRLMRMVHGFDAVLIMSGSTPSSILPRADEGA